MCLLSFADGSLVGSQVLGGVLLLVVLHHVNEVGVLGYGQEHLHVELALLALGPLVKRLERLEEGGDLNTTLLNQPLDVLLEQLAELVENRLIGHSDKTILVRQRLQQR